MHSGEQKEIHFSPSPRTLSSSPVEISLTKDLHKSPQHLQHSTQPCPISCNDYAADQQHYGQLEHHHLESKEPVKQPQPPNQQSNNLITRKTPFSIEHILCSNVNYNNSKTNAINSNHISSNQNFLAQQKYFAKPANDNSKSFIATNYHQHQHNSNHNNSGIESNAQHINVIEDRLHTIVDNKFQETTNTTPIDDNNGRYGTVRLSSKLH